MLRGLPTLVLTCCLVYASAPAEAFASENAPVALADQASEAAATELPIAPAASDTSFRQKVGAAADGLHDRLERGLLHQVVRLDDFFGTVDSQKGQQTSYLLRWRNALRLEHTGKLNLGSTLRADLDLSKISDRLDLAISGQDYREPLSPSLPEDPGNPGFDRTLQTTRIFNTELRYKLIRTDDDYLFLGAGVNLVWPPQFFARARYQHLQQISDRDQLRIAETLFVKTPYGGGETTEISIERVLTPRTVLRWANSGTVSQEIKALEWGSELSVLHELSALSAATLIAGVYGNTASSGWITDYRVLLRYRRNFLRDWLYYELEPQIEWLRSVNDSFPTTYAFTLRLEVVFQGKGKSTGKQ